LVAAVAGAAIYAVIIDMTKKEFSAGTLGIGLLVGFAVMALKPANRALPIISGVIALLGSIAGTLAGGTAIVAKIAADDYGRVVTYGQAFDLVRQSPGDFIDVLTVLFWAIGAWAGFNFVNRQVKLAHQSAAPAAPLAGPLLPPMTTPETGTGMPQATAQTETTTPESATSENTSEKAKS
jgi:hypothetical protein